MQLVSHVEFTPGKLLLKSEIIFWLIFHYLKCQHHRYRIIIDVQHVKVHLKDYAMAL
jgi:hypothetical protein